MSRTTTVAHGAILIASIAGLLDAARGDVWDLFSLFAVILVAQVLVVLSALTDRTSITVRPDLGRWISGRAHANGEPVDDVVDRALAFYQQGLYQPEHYPAGVPQRAHGDGD